MGAGQPDEAVRFYSAAVAIRPRSDLALRGLRKRRSARPVARSRPPITTFREFPRLKNLQCHRWRIDFLAGFGGHQSERPFSLLLQRSGGLIANNSPPYAATGVFTPAQRKAWPQDARSSRLSPADATTV